MQCRFHIIKVEHSPDTARWSAFTATLMVILLATPATVSAAANCGADRLSPLQARATIAFTQSQVREAHYVSASGSPDPPLTTLAQLSRSVTAPITSAALAHRINIALGAARDGHLRLELSPAATINCPSLPLSLAWTDDGILILPGSDIPAGARVLSIGGRSLDELEELAAQAIPHENIYWARSAFARQVVRGDGISALGLADPGGAVAVDYQVAEDAPVHVHLRLTRETRAIRPWVGYEEFKSDSTGLLWLQRCDPNDEFFKTLAEFVRVLNKDGLRKVVIDLRGNPGGDSSVALAVFHSLGLTVGRGFSVKVRVSAQLLHDAPMFAPPTMGDAFQAAGLPPPPLDAKQYTIPAPLVLGVLQQRLADRAFEVVTGRALYVLTDGGTFSSAALFATLVRDNKLGTLVGEPTGNAVSFNGSEIERPIPGMAYVLHISTARLLRPDESAGPAPTLLPDLLAAMTESSLRAGRDPAVEWVRRQ
jgi:hypothetical protein